jgi:phage portal protein BeeE
MKATEEDAKVVDSIVSARGIWPKLRRVIEAVKGPVSALSGAARHLPGGWRSTRGLPPLRVQQRANRAAAVDVDWFQGIAGADSGWARTEYGEYYASSVSVYAAIRIRAEALSRPPLVVYRQSADGARTPVGPSHPVHRLLERVNPWYTRGDLWRATETYLGLWGSSFWALEHGDEGQWEIWPLRPDRVSVLADRRQYIRGFVYQGRNGPVAYTPDEMLWIRYFNPLEEYAGMSPMAPARMAVDMGKDALRFNRNFLRNSAQPDFVLLTKEKMMPGLQVFPEGLPGKSRL